MKLTRIERAKIKNTLADITKEVEILDQENCSRGDGSCECGCGCEFESESRPSVIYRRLREIGYMVKEAENIDEGV